jgi:hypothetical protein
MAETLGNDAMQARLARAMGTRDSLLAFVVERLGRIRERQLGEADASRNPEAWHAGVGLGRNGFEEPKPTRWHASAALYQTAAAAICGGNLGRGAALLRKALDAESAGMAEYPGFLAEDTKPDELPSLPEAATEVASGEGCPTCPLPQEIDTADLILRIGNDPDPAPAPELRRRKSWWAGEEEEPEGEPGRKKPPESESPGGSQAGG